MDEADYLGDRIGILSCGKQVTCGSSMFLKSKFGVGYVINILKEDDSKGPHIMEKIHEFIPDAELSSDYGLEMKVQMLKGADNKFQSLFEFLEEEGESVGVKEFGVSLTTLEDVFLKVGNMFDDEAMEDIRLANEAKNKNKNENKNEKNDILKKLQNQVSAKDLSEESKPKKKRKVITFDPELVRKLEKSNLKDIRLTSTTKIWFKQLTALMKKRLLYLSRDKGGIICEILMPLILVIVGLALTKIQLIVDSPLQEMTPGYISLKTVQIKSNAKSSISRSDLEPYFKEQGVAYTSEPSVASVTEFQTFIKENSTDEELLDFYLDDPSTAVTLAKAQFTTPKGAPSLTLDSSKIIFYNIFFNTTFPNSPLVGSSLINNSLFKILTNDKSASIKMNLFPMKNTLGLKKIDNTADSFNISIMFSLAFAFIPTSIILFLIKERESGAKYQQVISGMYLSAYWVANFIVDYIKYLAPALLMYCFIFILDVNFLRLKDGEVASFILFMEYGPPLILLAYIFSFVFKGPSKGQIFIFLFVYLGSFIFSIASFVLKLVTSSRSYHDDYIVWIFRLFPFYNFTVSFLNMGNIGLFKIFYKWDVEPDYLEFKVTLYEIIFLLVNFVVLVLILVWIENWMGFVQMFKKSKKKNLEDFSDAPKEVREDIELKIKNENFGPVHVSSITDLLISRPF